MSSDAELLRAYRSAEYHVYLPDGVAVLTIGALSKRVSELLAQLDAPSAFVVTAHNPQSRRLSDEDNRRRHQALMAAVAALGLRWFATVGKDPSGRWPDEPGVAMVGTDQATAAEIAMRFDQRAFVEIPIDGPVSLIT